MKADSIFHSWHKSLTRVCLIFISLTIFAQLSFATAQQQAQSETGLTLTGIVKKIESAYGGMKLKNMQYFSQDDEYRETFQGQGYTPEYDNFWVVNSQARLDLKNQKGSYETWADQYGRIMQFHSLSTPEGIAAIDYETGYYALDSEATYYQMFGRVIRASDTLLAYELAQDKNKKTLADPVTYLGEKHDHIILELPASIPLHLYVNAKGYIKRMHRTFDNGDSVVYVFEDHNIWNGITFAREYILYVNGELIFLTKCRTLNQGRLNADTFVLPKGLQNEPERFSVTEITVIPLSEKLHHVGQEDFSSFYDAGDYIIGLGGYAGLKERFEAYLKARKIDKPLRYQIPTHHHSDHVTGIADAIELGATIVIPERLQANMLENIETLTESKVQTFTDRTELSTLKLYTISTSHTELLTVIYEPDSQSLFQSDHYAGFYKNVTNVVNRNSYTLYQGVKALNIDVKNILSAHVGKIEAWSDFETAAKQYTGQECYYKRSICTDK